MLARRPSVDEDTIGSEGVDIADACGPSKFPIPDDLEPVTKTEHALGNKDNLMNVSSAGKIKDILQVDVSSAGEIKNILDAEKNFSIRFRYINLLIS